MAGILEDIKLRDWFAGLAMQAMVGSIDQQWADGSKCKTEHAYILADSMLVVRNMDHDQLLTNAGITESLEKQG